MISSGALATCGFWGIDVLAKTQRGNPVAILKSLEDDSHVKTRISQYEALQNGKGIEIAKTLVVAKAKGYDQLLKKLGLQTIGFVTDHVKAIDSENKTTFRRKLMCYESRYSRMYFSQIFQLINEEIRPKGRRTYRAYDGLNNTFNLGYEILRWKVHIALIKSKLEPFLGFLHSLQYSKPSLVCDFMELYRYLVDDLIISFCRDLEPKDFVFKTEKHANRKAKRQYLTHKMTQIFVKKLDLLFQTEVGIPRVKVGKKQQIETLISEEALLLAKFLRGEKTVWTPRIASLA